MRNFSAQEFRAVFCPVVQLVRAQAGVSERGDRHGGRVLVPLTGDAAILPPWAGERNRSGAPCRGGRSGRPYLTPFTVTFTVWGLPEVAPVWSVTTTSKLAVGARLPSCVKLTLPASRSACVKLAAGRPGALAK